MPGSVYSISKFSRTGKSLRRQRASVFGAREKLFRDRTHELLPWIDSPLKYANGNDLYFHPRAEASLIELAFDLFFVANLATFTAYHGIIDMDTLGAYIGFFTIIWFTWLQVTLHDVRFAVDSFYERFEPQMRSENSITYETLCFVLFISRVLFTVQYSTVLVYVTVTHSTLVKPLLLLVATFVISSITFLAMIIASHTGSDYDIYYLWYAMCVFEAVSVLFISAKWKALSFKKTHLAERMGLLSMIVIGEGVIGTTKTVGKVILLVTILIFLWQLYFDNHPNGHHIDDSGKLGTIREVIWALLHYPLHLSFVAIEEGSQQLILTWEVWHNFQKFQSVLMSTCTNRTISGFDLTTALNASIYKFKFDNTLESNVMVDPIKKSLQEISNYTLPCNATVNLELRGAMPSALVNISDQVLGALYLYNDHTIPSLLAGRPNPTAADVYRSFTGSSQAIKDFLEYIRMGMRLVVMGICIGIAWCHEILIQLLRNDGMAVAAVVTLTFVVILSDRVSRTVGISRARKLGVIPHSSSSSSVSGDSEHGSIYKAPGISGEVKEDFGRLEKPRKSVRIIRVDSNSSAEADIVSVPDSAAPSYRDEDANWRRKGSNGYGAEVGSSETVGV
ncbi:hypothetical protein B0J14DRAFT_661441 [Halenospora varia]|nr:hypothetical protein B0J14DRAFT_661441 [Halenospora varia]